MWWAGPGVSMRSFVVLVVLGFALQGPSASASTGGVLPPEELVVEWAKGGVSLEWQPPAGAVPDAYRVYLDGQPFATTATTSALAPSSTAFGVTAIYGETESVPALVAEIHPTAPTDDDWCDPAPTSVETDELPFVHTGPQIHCFYWVLGLLSKSPEELPVSVKNRV